MRKRAIVIGITGGTGSGKTFLSKKLEEEFKKKEISIIQQDSYYKDLSHINPNDRAKVNFDNPNAFDIGLLQEQLVSLIQNNKVDIPIYDFRTHTRKKETEEVYPARIIILEGILVLHYPDLRNLMDLKIYIETPADIRFIRRFNRDLKERDRSADSIIRQYLTTVRPMFEKHVKQTKSYADIIIPGELDYRIIIDMLRNVIDTNKLCI